jgi:hypothetical protein
MRMAMTVEALRLPAVAVLVGIGAGGQELIDQ